MSKRSKKESPNIDGILRRQAQRKLTDASRVVGVDNSAKNEDALHYLDTLTQPKRGKQADLGNFDYDDSTQSIGAGEETKQLSRKMKRAERKQKRREKRANRRFKKLRRAALGFGALGVLAAGYFGYQLFVAGLNIFDRSGEGALALRDGIDPSLLNSEGDGRVNILLAGIGGETHTAGNLADTIIIASLDPFSKEVAMLSIPRDLYVTVPDFWDTRINAAHDIGEEFDFAEEGYPNGGMGLLQKTIETNLDVPIHYYVRGDFDAFKQAIDAVGGITIDVPEPIYDPIFSFADGGPLDLAAGEQYFDGTLALLYARTRKTSAQGDFSRTERQREILVSLKDKALSLGTLSNPIKISNLISAFGSNVRTNLSPSEILTIREIGSEISSDSIVSVGLRDDVDSYVVDANIGGASVLVPRTGDFTEIQQYIDSIFIDGFIKSEAASVVVLNGNGQVGAAETKSEELRNLGYNVIYTGTANSSNYQSTVVIDRSGGEKPYTNRYLEQRFGVISSPNQLYESEAVDIEADFVIIVGTDGETEI